MSGDAVKKQPPPLPRQTATSGFGSIVATYLFGCFVYAGSVSFRTRTANGLLFIALHVSITTYRAMVSELADTPVRTTAVTASSEK